MGYESTPTPTQSPENPGEAPNSTFDMGPDINPDTSQEKEQLSPLDRMREALQDRFDELEQQGISGSDAMEQVYEELFGNPTYETDDSEAPKDNDPSSSPEDIDGDTDNGEAQSEKEDNAEQTTSDTKQRGEESQKTTEPDQSGHPGSSQRQYWEELGKRFAQAQAEAKAKTEEERDGERADSEQSDNEKAEAGDDDGYDVDSTDTESKTEERKQLEYDAKKVISDDQEFLVDIKSNVIYALARGVQGFIAKAKVTGGTPKGVLLRLKRDRQQRKYDKRVAKLDRSRFDVINRIRNRRAEKADQKLSETEDKIDTHTDKMRDILDKPVSAQKEREEKIKAKIQELAEKRIEAETKKRIRQERRVKRAEIASRESDKSHSEREKILDEEMRTFLKGNLPDIRRQIIKSFEK